jgi:alpha-tubulin suppressor-like RCC1 family protein
VKKILLITLSVALLGVVAFGIGSQIVRATDTITNVSPTEGPTSGGTELTIQLTGQQPRFVSVATSGEATAAVTADGKLYTWGSDQYGFIGNDKACLTSHTYTDVEMLQRFIDENGYDPTDLPATDIYYNQTLPDDWGYQVWDEPITTAEQGTLAWWAVMWEGTGTTNAADTLQYLQDDYGYSSLADMLGVSDPLQQLYQMNFGEVNITQTNYICDSPQLVNGQGDMPADANIVQVFANATSTVFALDDAGNIYSWGQNGMAETGNGQTSDTVYVPQNITANFTAAGAGRIVQISIYAGGRAFALDENGKVFGWGYNSDGSIGIGTNGGVILMPTQLAGALAGVNVVKLFPGGGTAIALDDHGKAYVWGINSYKQLTGNESRILSPANLLRSDCSSSLLNNLKIVDITATDLGAMAVDENGDVWMWGSFYEGAAGNGVSYSYNNVCPTDISTMAGASTNSAIYGKKIVKLYSSISQQVVYAVDENGDWYDWGSGVYGLSLTWNPNDSANPVLDRVWPKAVNFSDTDLAGVEIIDFAVSTHAMALDADGNLYGWGYNQEQQVGPSTLDTAEMDGFVMTPQSVVWPPDYTSVVLDFDGVAAPCVNVSLVAWDAAAGTATIKCTTTAHPAGTVSVRVVNSTWSTVAVLDEAYAYVAKDDANNGGSIVPGVPNTGFYRSAK